MLETWWIFRKYFSLTEYIPRFYSKYFLDYYSSISVTMNNFSSDSSSIIRGKYTSKYKFNRVLRNSPSTDFDWTSLGEQAKRVDEFFYDVTTLISLYSLAKERKFLRYHFYDDIFANRVYVMNWKREGRWEDEKEGWYALSIRSSLVKRNRGDW